jgi:hypothetical protein
MEVDREDASAADRYPHRRRVRPVVAPAYRVLRGCWRTSDREVGVIRFLFALAALGAAGCGPGGEVQPRGMEPPGAVGPPTAGAAERAEAEERAARVLARETARIEAEAARIDSIFQPLPLLRPARENVLRRYGNAEHLQRARALGIGRGLPPERIDALVQEGALVTLEDTRYWVIREMEFARPLAVPAVRALLTEIGERFHARLEELGAPPYRLEVTSVLRTAADQAALRRVNPNAAAGESTHEYGTTVDVLYSAYAAPDRPIVQADAAGAEWLAPHLERHAALAAERIAGRRALELKAVLGEVLIRMQDEGKVRVTIERLQPVFHMTVARQM